ncbi:hypothetical protein LJ737_05225 [Hymenobacter sp. 15J16-1T3B]|uniref:hypothetical protein n=1 Tax=Hymenobacter sp. 15J16-1T3B TaxID=2886941 RepID=UPI001D105CEF|nr:hypothetical protein [Hymenobacter sp. 15J16-1T3B]MCC3156628.1 hypothetical protein [Hymenobacter sp. 15J16-1T3B]
MKRRTAAPPVLQQGRNPFPSVDSVSFSWFSLVGRPVYSGAVFLCPLMSSDAGETAGSANPSHHYKSLHQLMEQTPAPVKAQTFLINRDNAI